MKRKIFLVIVSLLSAVMLFGCSKSLALAPYEGNYENEQKLVVDDFITLDGELNEDIWVNSKNGVDIPGAVKDAETKQPVDPKYGDRAARVYSYVGEKAIYFAAEVQDKNLYFNENRAQGQNSTVEIYFSDISIGALNGDCWSFRATPTGKDGDEAVLAILYNMHRYKHFENGWVQTWRAIEVEGKSAAAVKVNGKVKNSADDTEYTTDGNEGYTVEMAVSIDLLTKNKDAVQYTAAFCQSRGFDKDTEKRIGNSIIPGTSFNDPSKWIVATNDAVYSVNERNAYLETRVVPDEGVTIDGAFDEDIWKDTVPRAYSTPLTRSATDSEPLVYSVRAATTDNGVYIGVESNDREVYFHEGLREQFSTGAEIGITANKATMIDDKYTVQYRINANGDNYRLRGKMSDGKTAFSYNMGVYFPAKSAARVLGEGINTGKSDGWAAEIYIPWTSFNGEVNVRDSIAINLGGYRASKNGQSKSFVSPVDILVYSYGGPRMNPQTRWFTFKDGKPDYDGFSLPSVTLDKNDLVNGVYSTTIKASYIADVVTANGYDEIFPSAVGGAFDFGGTKGIVAADNGDGTYTLKMTSAAANEFTEGKSIGFVSGDKSSKFTISVDNDFALDGIKNEPAYAQLKPITTTQTDVSGATATAESIIALRDNCIHLCSVISDAAFTAKGNTLPLGLELNISLDEKFSYENSYRVSLYSNENGGRVYRYNELTLGNTQPWRVDYTQTDDIEKVVVDNNDGTYTIEARIPYSAIGVSEKPERIFVSPCTSFVVDSSKNTVKSMLLDWSAESVAVNLGAYQTFDESGFAPRKMELSNINKDKVEFVNIVRGQGVVEDKYTGIFNLSLFDGSRLPVTDAQFGEYTQYITSVGDGKYAYAIPTSMLKAERTTVPVTSQSSALSSSVTLRMLTAAEMIVSADGLNLFTTDKNGDNYEFYAKVTADAEGLIPLLGVKFNGVTATDYGNGKYLLSIPASKFANTSAATILATFEGEKTLVRSFAINYTPWTQEQLGKVKSYIDFNGDITDAKGNTVTENGSVEFVDRLGNGDAVKLVNKTQTVKIAQGLGTGDFSISFDFKINAADAHNTSARYELFDSGLANDGTNDKNPEAFQISVRSDWGSLGLRIQAGLNPDEDKQDYSEYGFKELDEIMLPGKWHTLTLLVDRNAEGSTETDERVTLTLYLNGELIATNILKHVVPGTVFGGDELNLGGGNYGTLNKSLEMDNFLLYDGLLSPLQVYDIAVSTKSI